MYIKKWAYTCTLLLSTEMGRFNILIYLIIIHRITHTAGEGVVVVAAKFPYEKNPPNPFLRVRSHPRSFKFIFLNVNTRKISVSKKGQATPCPPFLLLCDKNSEVKTKISKYY